MTTSYFDYQNNINSDTCWQTYVNKGNDKMFNYRTYDKSSQLLDCDEKKVRVPDFMLEHPNLRGRAGYGLADPCLIDNYNNLVNNDELLTHNKSKIQLYSRIFTAVPYLKASNGDIDKELQLLAGEDTTASYARNRKLIMEQQINQPEPLLDFIREIQNPDNIVPVWVNGGEDTRSYANRMYFNKNN